MAAYTPGLTVSSDTVITKTRRLPLKGKVLVERGALVSPDTIVARAELPGVMHSVKAAAALGIEPNDLPAVLGVAVGDTVQKGQVIAQTRGLWGLFRSEAKSNAAGVVELVSPVTGTVGVREPSTPIEVAAYLPGVISDILPGEGATITAHGALVQGIFGVGGERRAPLRAAVSAPDKPLTENDLTSDMAGCLVVGGANVSLAALRRAAEVGVSGIVVGGIVDEDLIAFLGHDIGVAITGHEDIPFSLVLTEGFGTIAMARRTFDLLTTLEGRAASFSGATQIRAGVIRPEIIVAVETTQASQTTSSASPAEDGGALAVGAPIRIIREPYFGVLATVAALPPALTRVASGAEVRVLEARLPSGELVTVPRANVELLAV